MKHGPRRLFSRPRLACPALGVFTALFCPIESVAGQDDEKSKSTKLEQVVISASGFEQKKKDAPASITVITREEIQRQRASSLTDILSNVEGIDVGGTAGKTGGLSIMMRGMPSDYTLVLVDGKRQNAAGNVTPNGFGETSTSFLPPPSEIDRIEVIRGPMATLYGSDAMGGVINVITRKTARRWRGTLSSDATVQGRIGFGNSYSTNGSISGPVIKDRMGVSLRGTLFHRKESDLSPTGSFADNTTISKRGPSPVEAKNFNLGGRVTLLPATGHELWVDADRSRQSYENGQAQLGTLDDPTTDSYNGYGPKLRFHRDQLALTHGWSPFSGSRMETSVTRNTTATLGRTIPKGTPGGPPGSGAPDKIKGSSRALESSNTMFDTKLTSAYRSHVLTVGGQVWGAKMIDGVALDPFKFTQWSVFAEDEWRFVNNFALTVGLRRDDHSAFGGQVSPRAYLVWTATPDWSIKGGVSRGYKTPRVEQLMDGIIGFTSQGRTATIGSPNLTPEKSTTTELGAYYTNDAGYSVNFSLFNNDFDDKIASGTPIPNCTFAADPDRPGCVNYGNFPTQETFSQSINIDKAITRGGEFGARVPLGQRAALNTSYTYTTSEQRSGDDKGMPLVNTPKHMLNAKLNAQATERISTWIQGEYRSKRARRTSAGENLAYDALGDFKPYSLFHLGGSVRVSRGVSVNATIHNLLNKDFLTYGAYSSPTAAEPDRVLYTNLYNNHQEGRRLWLSTTISF